MKDTSTSDLSERETKWKREIRQLTSDLQRASSDARELNMQLMTLKAKSPQVVTRIERIEVESHTCKLALEKCSASLDQSRTETRCLRSQLTALGNKYQEVEQRLSKATEHAANLQPVCRDHDELTGRLRLLESESVERNDQGVREQSVRQEPRRIAYHSVDKSFHHMRDEVLHLLQENEERHRTMRVREAEVGEEGYRDEPVPVHTRSQDMGSPSQKGTGMSRYRSIREAKTWVVPRR